MKKEEYLNLYKKYYEPKNRNEVIDIIITFQFNSLDKKIYNHLITASERYARFKLCSIVEIEYYLQFNNLNFDISIEFNADEVLINQCDLLKFQKMYTKEKEEYFSNKLSRLHEKNNI